MMRGRGIGGMMKPDIQTQAHRQTKSAGKRASVFLKSNKRSRTRELTGELAVNGLHAVDANNVASTEVA